MGGNLAYQRRQPVRKCPDETVHNDRFGVCIRKTNYRPEQEDRVSSLFKNLHCKHFRDNEINDFGIKGGKRQKMKLAQTKMLQIIYTV